MKHERTLRLVRESNHLVSGRNLPPTAEEIQADDSEIARRSRRVWAASMLARDLATCTSILRRLAVRAGNLDGVILRRALRGAPLPPADSYIPVTDELLDAIVEAGPL